MAEIQPGRYRHSKGNEYRVVGVARHSKTLEEFVVYGQEYGERGLWVRRAAELSRAEATERSILDVATGGREDNS